MYDLLLIALLTGIFVKIVDTIEDEKIKSFRYIAHVFGIFYGLLVGFVIVTFTDVAPLWIGVIFGVALTKKIDTLSHVLGVSVAAATALIAGIPKLNYYFVGLFTLASFFDEKIDMYLHKVKKKRTIHHILEARFTVEICALLVSLFTGNWAIFLAILFFDIGYLLVEHSYRKLKKK